MRHLVSPQARLVSSTEFRQDVDLSLLAYSPSWHVWCVLKGLSLQWPEPPGKPLPSRAGTPKHSLNICYKYEVQGCCVFPAWVAAVGSAAVLFSLAGRQSRTCLLLCCRERSTSLCPRLWKTLPWLFFWQNPLIIILSSFSSCLLAKYLPCAAVKSCFQREINWSKSFSNWRWGGKQKGVFSLLSLDAFCLPCAML